MLLYPDTEAALSGVTSAGGTAIFRLISKEERS
jgi:hypothetical protein